MPSGKRRVWPTLHAERRCRPGAHPSLPVVFSRRSTPSTRQHAAARHRVSENPTCMNIAYTKGLHELGDGLYAYLQPDGGWGWSNAGLITAPGTSLLVDTLFDLKLTREMLDAMQPVTDKNPIGQAFNTHGNGDHWFGNGLLPDGIPIIASTRAIEDMRAAPPAAVNALFNQVDLGPEFEAFAARTMRKFDFASVTERLPDQSFGEDYVLDVGDRRVRLLQLGPAHTSGDSIAYVPDASTV